MKEIIRHMHKTLVEPSIKDILNKAIKDTLLGPKCSLSYNLLLTHFQPKRRTNLSIKHKMPMQS